MTLGEFREQTKGLSDDLVLEFYSERYNDSTQPIRLEFDTGGYVEFVIDDDRWYLKQEPKWIPCTERLPEKEYLNYLVSTSDDEVDIGSYGSEKGWSMCDADGFYYPRHRGIEVVAWTPLPESYKAKAR